MNIIYLAGINNSEPLHWQRLWYRLLGGHWLEQTDWDHPRAVNWVACLQETLRAVSGPKILLGHSLGSHLVAEWARTHRNSNLRGAFLVAPPDVEGMNFPREASGFTPPLDLKLPFPSFIVASRNDPYSTVDYSRRLADGWKSDFVDVGEKGHINLKSGLGFWEEGFKLFRAFCSSLSE